MKSFLQNNNIKMYSTHNEGKSVTAERFIRTLKYKIFKYMNSISKNVYIHNLDDKVNEYNNTYHSTVRINPVDVKSSTYIDSSEEINDKDSKFIIGDIARISKYKNIFAKDYDPTWSEEFFFIKKLRTMCRGNVLLAKKIGFTFYDKKLQNTNQKEFRVEKVFKIKVDKLYVKWKDYNNSFNSWIDKKDMLKIKYLMLVI